jgi:hypothetical protein
MQLTNAQREHLERRLREERESLLRDLNRGLADLSDDGRETPTRPPKVDR